MIISVKYAVVPMDITCQMSESSPNSASGLALLNSYIAQSASLICLCLRQEAHVRCTISNTPMQPSNIRERLIRLPSYYQGNIKPIQDEVTETHGNQGTDDLYKSTRDKKSLTCLQDWTLPPMKYHPSIVRHCLTAFSSLFMFIP